MASVGVLAIVGVTDRSMRSMMPASSSRRNRSSRDVAAVCRLHACRRPCRGRPPGSGWITARLNIHGSRGRTQQIASGSTPRPSSQTQASVAVLPEPTTTYWLGASSSRARSLTGITRAPVGDLERRRRVRRDVGREVARVDDPAALRDLEPLARRRARRRCRSPRYSQLGEELDLARRRPSARPARGRSRRRSRRRSPARAGPPPARAVCTRPPPSSVDATP